MEKKAPLRRELLARRDALPGREERSRAIQRQVLALPEYRRARRLLLYLSQGSEVDTWPLLTAHWPREGPCMRPAAWMDREIWPFTVSLPGRTWPPAALACGSPSRRDALS